MLAQKEAKSSNRTKLAEGSDDVRPLQPDQRPPCIQVCITIKTSVCVQAEMGLVYVSCVFAAINCSFVASAQYRSCS